MEYLHYDLSLASGDIIIVNLDKQANVLLLDSSNYSNYKAGRRYQYFGGLAKVSRFRVAAPSAGQWHVVINLGGYPGIVKASVSVNR
ncbi:MAG: hypothetical protein JWN76_2463 [Chitinophagaceae bacterium]|nr:hypothetical protein [Chitinophagaceae bacterium]